MVSEKKKRTLQEVKGQMKEYPVIGVIDMHKLPGRQLHEIRNKLRGEAVIRTAKKRIITRAIEQSDLSGIKEIAVHVKGETALMFSKTDPFKLARKIEKSKSPAQAKPGDIAPNDIMIKAGPTNLPPGPAIGELQKIKLPAGVQGDKITIMKDTVVAKEGEEISKDVADVLSKLGIEPMEIGLNLVAAWENGVIYPASVMFVPVEEYVRQIEEAGSAAFNLSININHFTQETAPFLLAKASREADSLATAAGIMTPGTAGTILAKAAAQADALAGLVKEPESPGQDAKTADAEPAKEAGGDKPAESDNHSKPKEE